MITEYHRPQTLEEAVELASSDGAVVIAGGTSVNATRDPRFTVAVDLQALDLSDIEASSDTAWIGATATLQQIVDSKEIPEVLRDLARREAPRTIRNVATVGGTIGAADADSQLLTGLLAYGAHITASRSDSTTGYGLDELLGNRRLLDGAIMTNVTIPRSGRAAAARTGRTPMDVPIVSVAGRHDGSRVTLAIAGAAHRPVIVDTAHVADLKPPSDFRGSSKYRRHLARTLSDRVLAEIAGDE